MTPWLVVDEGDIWFGQAVIVGILLTYGFLHLLVSGLLFFGYLSPERVFAPSFLGPSVILAACIFLLRGLAEMVSGWGVYTWRFWARPAGLLMTALLAVRVLGNQVNQGVDGFFRPSSALMVGVVFLFLLAWFFIPQVRSKFAERGQPA